MSEELQQLVPIEEQISQELVKQNVTEAIIANLKEKYLPLKISGIEDKETYLLVKDARKECKALRVLAKKICEKGREDAVAIQKAWVGKQKEVTDQIAEVEDYLEKQEKEFEAAVAKDKEDRKRRNEEQLITRHQLLSSMGVLYSDGYFTLGEVSFELSLIKESEPDIWEESILPKFNAEYEVVQAAVIKEAEAKRLADEEFKKQQEELERGKRELAEKEAALKKALEEQEQAQRREDYRKITEANAKKQALVKERLLQVTSLGFIYNGIEYYRFHEFAIILDDVHGLSDEDWSLVMSKATAYVTEKKAELEQKRLAEIEDQRERQRISDLRMHRCELLIQYGVVDHHEDVAKYNDEQWESLLEDARGAYEEQQRLKWEKEQEDKRQQEEVVRLQKLDAAKDKDKWDEIMKKVNEIEVYEMRSSQYRKKAMILREKLEEIKAL